MTKSLGKVGKLW